MIAWRQEYRRPLLTALLLLGLAACSSSPPAPVVDKSAARQEIPVDGLYHVRRGDSLHAIAFKYGLDYRDIASWNSIRSPYTIYPDQVLRLRRPPRSARSPSNSTASTSPAPSRKAETRPAPPAAVPPPQRTVPGSNAGPSEWVWPADGRLLRTFKQGDPSRNGLDIAGREGQAIKASAAGQVVYSGDGLIGYGELVIIKHSDQLLSAYAHNRARLVKEGESVKQGQKIAELGRNDRNEEILHFEIRRNGEPVDPMKYLPGQ